MDVFFALCLLLCLGCLVVGLIRPSVFRLSSRKNVGIYFGIASLVLFFLIGASGDADAPVAPESEAGTIAAVTESPSTPLQPDIQPEPEVFDQTASDVESQHVTDAPASEGAVLLPDEEVPVAAEPQEASGEPATVDTAGSALFSVVAVVDGDTVKVSIDGVVETLRLIGIDTPETKDPRKPIQCFGNEASTKAVELLSGRRVRLEADPTQGDRDKYGRLLRYLWREDGLFFNEWMIRNGYAHEYTYNIPYTYHAGFKAAERYASENSLGLWSPTTCAGDTSEAAVSSEAESPEGIGHTFYTSSHWSAKYYYCDTDPGWESLSKSYLRSFPSEAALLAAYPSSRTLHEACK